MQTVSKLLDPYGTLARQETFGKSEDKLRRWDAPRQKTLKNVTAIAGDKDSANAPPATKMSETGGGAGAKITG